MTVTEPRAPASEPVVAEIAAQLGETEAMPLRQIARAVATLGEERARAFVAEALAVEARGGLLLPDGSRRRTLGGVFFHLVRQGVTRDERRAIFPHVAGGPRGRPATTEAPFTWEDYPTALAQLGKPGEATTVKLTAVGRPNSVAERGPVVLVGLRSDRAPSLPKGLPTPTQPTGYMLLIARKQWDKVAASLRRPDDVLIVEGYPTLDARFQGITVLATRTTTKLLQQAERQRQQAKQEWPKVDEG
jgi:hypothetical protein